MYIEEAVERKRAEAADSQEEESDVHNFDKRFCCFGDIVLEQLVFGLFLLFSLFLVSLRQFRGGFFDQQKFLNFVELLEGLPDDAETQFYLSLLLAKHEEVLFVLLLLGVIVEGGFFHQF